MKALIVVDVQNDFLLNGNLAVKDANNIIPGINNLIASDFTDVIVFTKDFHPATHKSFASQHPGRAVFDVVDLGGVDQTLWPDHCIQETSGSEFPPDLEVPEWSHLIFKGLDKEVDSYSAFYDNNNKNPSGLTDYLKDLGITKVAICGLAFNLCVMFTALDAKKDGFEVSVIENLCKSVIINPGDHEAAKNTMIANGIAVIEI